MDQQWNSSDQQWINSLEAKKTKKMPCLSLKVPSSESNG